MPRISRFPASSHPPRLCAFTLTELLAVVAVIAILLGLGATTLSFRSTAAPTNAIGEIMGTLDYARTIALAESRSVYVVFAGKEAPSRYAFRAYAVFKAGKGTDPMTQDLPWKLLPEGVILKEEASSIMDEDTSADSVRFPFPGEDGRSPSPFIEFTATGSVGSPTSPGRLRVVLCQGVREEGREVVTAKGEDGIALTEEVVVSRSSGRPRRAEP